MKKNSQIVDFNFSSFAWLGDSSGRFKISSLLRARNKNNSLLYILTESGLAGNVYSEDELIKTPSYLFQVIASKDYQKIFRTDIDKDILDFQSKYFLRKSILDSESKDLFKNININLKYKTSISIKNFSELKFNFLKFDFVCHIYIKTKNYDFVLEFPINHLNLNEKEKKWQVETGPVIFPIYNEKTNTCDFFPSFLMFNSFEKVDIFLDYPLKKRQILKIKNNIIYNYKCKIKIFT